MEVRFKSLCGIMRDEMDGGFMMRKFLLMLKKFLRMDRDCVYF